MSLKLYLLRHGETEYSRSGGYCGDTDAELTDNGREMAKRFADAYKTMEWKAIYSSPMRRALATAKPLSAALGLKVQPQDGLREIRYGKWEGKTSAVVKQDYADDYHKWLAEPAWNAPTGGETAVEIANRAMPIIYQIEKDYTDGNVLVVSHKATIRIILCSLLGIELGRYRDRINALAASVSMVRFTEHGPLLELLGDRSYFSEELKNLPGT